MSLDRAATPTDWRMRVGGIAFAVGAIILALAVIYQWALGLTVGEDISFVQALQVVVEAVTTAGFGGDTELWRQSDTLAGLVIVMNLTGVILVFLAIPLFGVPLFREAMTTRPPTTTTLTGHVIICGYSPQDEVLSEELQSVDIPYLYVDSDPDLITRLTEEGRDALLGDPQRNDTLEAANVGSARALVADIADETNPAVLLSAKQLNPDVRAISVIRKPEVATYHEYAGADEIVPNRQVLGRGLAHRAAGTYTENLREAIQVENELRITDLRVEQGSELVGQTIREATAPDRLNLTIIGAWFGGKFEVSPDPDAEIEENTILMVAGDYPASDDIRAIPIPSYVDDRPRVIVCGYGTVGHSVTKTLREKGAEIEIVDIQDKPGVDIVGDIADPETFLQADVETARAVVLSIDEDVKSIYATLVINQLAPETEIIVRADDADSVQALYNASADLVLSLPEITGEILASLLIEDVEIVTPDIDFDFERVPGEPLAGLTLAEMEIRQRTGCTVVAAERSGTLITEPGGNFAVEVDDVLIVAGSNSSHARLRELIERIENAEESAAARSG